MPSVVLNSRTRFRTLITPPLHLASGGVSHDSGPHQSLWGRNEFRGALAWQPGYSSGVAIEQPIMRPRALENMAYRPTNSIPSNLGDDEDESFILMGDFSDLVMGVRMEASVEALRLQSFAENLMLEFVGWTRLDFMVRRPASFVALNGVTV